MEGSLRSLNDEELVRRCLERDHKALEELILRYTPLTRGLVFSFIGPVRDVEDIVQEVFFQAIKSLRHLRQPDRFNSWLYKITRRVSHGWLRAQEGSLSLESEDALEMASGRLEGEVDEDRARMLDEVRRVVQELPELYREVVILRYFSKVDYETMAETLGLSPSAVNARLVKARKMLRRKLEPKHREGWFHGM